MIHSNDSFVVFHYRYHSYLPENIVSNLLLKIKKDIVKYHPQFDIKIVKSSENQIRGFSIAW